MSRAIKPVYSICMVNLNMADYIQQSILSIINQLDETFEVIVVDGGSTDASVERVKELQNHHNNLKLYQLNREKDRRLGEDRNISIKMAEGEYVLLHLDCDDLYHPFIKDWVKVFHLIEKGIGKDILVAGHHINMAKRKLMLENPYKNLKYEDRELWNRMEKKELFVSLKHKNFVIRMDLGRYFKLKKIIKNTFYQMLENLSDPNNTISSYIRAEVNDIKSRTLVHNLARFVVFPISLVAFLIKGDVQKVGRSGKIFVRKKPRTVKEIFRDLNKEISELDHQNINWRLFE